MPTDVQAAGVLAFQDSFGCLAGNLNGGDSNTSPIQNRYRTPRQR